MLFLQLMKKSMAWVVNGGPDMLNMNLARNLEYLRVRNESPAFLATRAILKVRACHFATSLVRGLMIRGQKYQTEPCSTKLEKKNNTNNDLSPLLMAGSSVCVEN